MNHLYTEKTINIVEEGIPLKIDKAEGEGKFIIILDQTIMIVKCSRILTIRGKIYD